jgi:hypothetical protein
MSCKHDMFVPTKAICQRAHVSMRFRLASDTRNLFCLIFENVVGAIQKFPGNLDDGLRHGGGLELRDH